MVCNPQAGQGGGQENRQNKKRPPHVPIRGSLARNTDSARGIRAEPALGSGGVFLPAHLDGYLVQVDPGQIACSWRKEQYPGTVPAYHHRERGCTGALRCGIVLGVIEMFHLVLSVWAHIPSAQDGWGCPNLPGSLPRLKGSSGVLVCSCGPSSPSWEASRVGQRTGEPLSKVSRCYSGL